MRSEVRTAGNRGVPVVGGQLKGYFKFLLLPRAGMDLVRLPERVRAHKGLVQVALTGCDVFPRRVLITTGEVGQVHRHNYEQTSSFDCCFPFDTPVRGGCVFPTSTLTARDPGDTGRV
jgi:hypothetical protein